MLQTACCGALEDIELVLWYRQLYADVREQLESVAQSAAGLCASVEGILPTLWTLMDTGIQVVSSCRLYGPHTGLDRHYTHF